MEIKKERYGIGEQDFKSLRDRGCVYVDKTQYIHRITEAGGKYFFLARPRRFGKSLFLSTLRYFFEGERSLFEGLYIDSTGWDWEKYPVLRLDLNTGDYSEASGLDPLLDYQFLVWERVFGIEKLTADHSARFRNILEQLHAKTGRQVVILVDEYDKPLVRNLSREELFEKYRAKLASLYSNFKTCAEHIRLVFLTGVSRFSKLSIFSDLNNINDITFDNDYADICGITVKECEDYFPGGLDRFAEEHGFSREEAFSTLKRSYDGYRFAEKGSDVFNPWSVLNALQQKKIEFFWNDTGTPTIVGEQLKKIDANLEEVFNTRCQSKDLKGLDLLNPNPIALLYQTGYLTIKDYDREASTYQLGIPNDEVKDGLFSVLLPYYMKSRYIPANQYVNEAASQFVSGQPDKAMKNIQAYLAGVDYTMRIEDENNFHNAFFLLMDLIGIPTTTECHTSEGRIDILIQTQKFVYVIELKYDHSAEDAMRQIHERHYARRFQTDSRKVFLIGASFSSATRCIEKWIIEELNSQSDNHQALS